MVDGLALGELQGSILKERRELSEEGLVLVSIVLSNDGTLLATPTFESRGFLHLDDAAKLKEELVASVEKAVLSLGAKAASDLDLLQTKVKGRIRDALRRFGRSKPMITPVVTVLGAPSKNGKGRRG